MSTSVLPLYSAFINENAGMDIVRCNTGGIASVSMVTILYQCSIDLSLNEHFLLRLFLQLFGELWISIGLKAE